MPSFRPLEGKKGEAEPLLPIAAHLVPNLLEELARGNAVSVNAIEAKITTQQADLLKISRLVADPTARRRQTALPPHRHPPSHEAVLAYKAEAHANRKAALDEMSAD